MRYPSVSVGAARDFGLLGVLCRGRRRGGAACYGDADGDGDAAAAELYVHVTCTSHCGTSCASASKSVAGAASQGSARELSCSHDRVEHRMLRDLPGGQGVV